MKQTEKDLLLKDLCARLPYGVKVQRLSYQIPLKILSINPNGVTWVTKDTGYPFEVDWAECKPYLFPLSSMTERQIFEINEILGGNFEIDKYGITDLIRNKRTTLSYLELNALFEYFNKNHFDYRGLIPMGLAIDATGLNIY